MPKLRYPWRERLQPAKFRDAEFHVETSSWSGGRRVSLHEYPKRDTPYAEDMGRRATRHTVDGYLIMSPSQLNYLPARDALRNALEQDGSGPLYHPLLGHMTVMCEQYTMTESRERGGYCSFSMVFVEAGSSGAAKPDTQAQVSSAASALEGAAGGALGRASGGGPNPSVSIGDLEIVN